MQQNNPQDEFDSIIEAMVGEHKLQEYIEIDLPSRGLGYKFTDGGDKLKIKPMDFADEKAILTAQKNGSDSITILLARCVLNMNPQKLYIFDKVCVLMKIREHSYGDAYQATVPCPLCSKENHLEIKLSVLAITHVEDDFTNPISITLPKIDKVAKIRIPRAEDEGYFGTFDKSVGNLWRFVESIGEYSNPVLIAKLIERLPLRDVNTIIKAVLNPKYGIMPIIKMDCAGCSKISRVELPITSDFFMGS